MNDDGLGGSTATRTTYITYNIILSFIVLSDLIPSYYIIRCTWPIYLIQLVCLTSHTCTSSYHRVRHVLYLRWSRRWSSYGGPQRPGTCGPYGEPSRTAPMSASKSSGSRPRPLSWSRPWASCRAARSSTSSVALHRTWSGRGRSSKARWRCRATRRGLCTGSELNLSIHFISFHFISLHFIALHCIDFKES